MSSCTIKSAHIEVDLEVEGNVCGVNLLNVSVGGVISKRRHDNIRDIIIGEVLESFLVEARCANG